MPYLSETFTSRFEADMAAEYLAEHEIEARVCASDGGGSIPAMQPTMGVRLEVSDEEFAAAELLVRGWRSSEESSIVPLSRSERLQSWLVGIVLVIVLAALLTYLARNIGSTTERPEVPIQAQTPF